jgi:hypothetical protein
MAWFKLTAPNGGPVQVNSDQLVCIRVPLAGVPPGPPTQAIIEFTTGHTQATLETPDQILGLIAGKTVPEETAAAMAMTGAVGATAPVRQAARRATRGGK